MQISSFAYIMSSELLSPLKELSNSTLFIEMLCIVFKILLIMSLVLLFAVQSHYIQDQELDPLMVSAKVDCFKKLPIIVSRHSFYLTLFECI